MGVSGALVFHKHILFSAAFNSSPNNKFLDWSNLKELADDNINMIINLKFVLGRVENTVGKGENAGYQHFLLFPTMFSKGFYLRVLKSQDCVVKIYINRSACYNHPRYLVKRLKKTTLKFDIYQNGNILNCGFMIQQAVKTL